MTVNTFQNRNINPFGYSSVTKPNERQVFLRQNVFIPQIIEQQRTQIPFESEQIKSLNLNESLLAKFLPQNFIAKYLNEGFIKKQIQTNLKIQELLAEKGISGQPNLHNVRDIIHTHLIPTVNYAKLIMQKSGITFSQEDYSVIEQATLLHDIGKIFIPVDILNKKGKLSKEEREIINLHDELGVELLKNSSINPQVLTLIGAHHDSKENENNILVQILKIADIYSALKENRAYRPAMSNEEAFDILYQKAQNGEFSKSLVDVLKNAIREENKLQDVIVA